MIKSMSIRLAILGVVLAVALLSLYPSVVPKDNGKPVLPGWWTKIKMLPQRSISLGLDIRGGIYLVYLVKVEEMQRLESEKIIQTAESADFQTQGVQVADSKIAPNGEVQVQFANQDSYQKGAKTLQDKFSNMFDVRQDRDNPLMLIFAIKPVELARSKENALQQVWRTVSNRVNAWGLSETSVQIKRPDQLSVEIPGITDEKRVEDVIKTTANLELKIVQGVAQSRESLLQEQGGRISKFMDVYEQKNKIGVPENYYLLNKQADITGECISSARMSFGGQQMGMAPVVSFTLKPGADCTGKFSRLTANNIDKQLAIVLDNVVISAPVIRSRISDSGMIEGNFTAESATDLAIVLTTGSLNVPIEKSRGERIGPSIGRDGIRRGEMALIIGSLLVVVFMAVYYKLAGVYADIAVLSNIIFVMAALATFGATLTLPGLAGIVLTVGIAVDANVLINERIREELRSGKTPQSSIELGYSRAFITIVDTHVTTFISGLVLYFNGTGPVKGFAITLMFGIAASLFTAVYVTRMMVDYWLERHPGESLSI